MSHLDDTAALFARMGLQEQREALRALGLPERLPKEPQGPPKVTPFSALAGTPGRRKRQPLTVRAVNSPETS
ncbi:hypothetical protein [[Kitasatospora] papulosa]|uniref:hypothetical protein n=1 Tax=[Kitasatospora] papulosa TaxID=1464011 RepID=UPI00369E2FDD